MRNRFIVTIFVFAGVLVTIASCGASGESRVTESCEKIAEKLAARYERLSALGSGQGGRLEQKDYFAQAREVLAFVDKRIDCATTSEFFEIAIGASVRANEIGRAKYFVEKAYEKNIRTATIVAQHSQIESMQGNSKNSLVLLEEANRLDRGSLVIRMMLCVEYSQSDQAAEAIAACTSIIDEGETSYLIPALQERARSYVELGDVSSAARDYQQIHDMK